MEAVFSPEYASIVGGWGLILGVFGVFLSVLGFGLTIAQIQKVESATTAAKSAIDGMRIRFSLLDIIQECAKAEKALEAIRHSLIVVREEVSFTNFDALATAFVNVLETPSPLTEETRSRIISAVKSIDRLSQSKPASADDRTTFSKQASTIRDFHGLIVHIKSQVHEDHAK